ncbi:Gfo/Idh/MocA family protein [Fundidesulfovibrio agrisoli]|uniref:Gfo/Idh/MocA family protein n=1 Tax=Fundidesulfovibrio agrisoli TaxID=2922717 RepID=UPI002435B8E6|nr:Gfo/Idh/MocA family oxidoreductase [Fundidesulfovibrio agrisoli]
MIKIGLIGYGYWGPNLARNFSRQPGCQLTAICEANPGRARQAALDHPGCWIGDDSATMLAATGVDAVVIATPVGCHYHLAKQALMAGRHVLVEKPITETAAEALELVELAERRNLVLAVDHTFLFTGAVRKIKELVDSKALGDFLYVDSVRINLGLFQPDVNVLYDLAPHDLSIVGHLLGEAPKWARAMGACHAGVSQENIVYLHLEYPGGLPAHFHLSWLAPVKIRKTLIAGSERMIVYDDLDQGEKVKVYDKGITVNPDTQSLHNIKVDYRTGDMFAPKLSQREALSLETEHFLRCLRGEEAPLCSGRDGLGVVRILEAAQRSLKAGGSRVEVERD